MNNDIRWDEKHLFVSYRLANRIVYTLGAVGLVLGAFGIRAGYAALPPDGDRIVTVALVVVALTLLGAFAYARKVSRR